MKKLMVMMIAISFLVIGSGSALADEPATEDRDRHSVWTNWYGEDGKRIPGVPEHMDSPSEMDRKVSTDSGENGKMTGEPGKFDFIRETQTYDYSKDRGNAV